MSGRSFSGGLQVPLRRQKRNAGGSGAGGSTKAYEGTYTVRNDIIDEFGVRQMS